MIPNPAALKIFSEVWSEYAMFAETDQRDPDVLNFMLDVEYAIRTLYPQLSAYQVVHARLSVDPRGVLSATRCALGSSFLVGGLWPVRSYFNGK